MIFSLYPHMAQIRKRGMPSIKEIFIKSDPNAKDAKDAIQSNPNLQNNAYMSMHSGGDAKNELSSNKSGGLGNLASLRKKDGFNYLNLEKSFGVNNPTGAKSIMSGSSHTRPNQVGFADSQAGKYDAPTLARLNPELYKEMAKQAK